jgi:type I restriction enzyme M protein
VVDRVGTCTAIPAGTGVRAPYEERVRRDELNLGLVWIRDRSLGDSQGLPPPDALAEEIADDLQAALAEFVSITLGLRDEVTGAGTGK